MSSYPTFPASYVFILPIFLLYGNSAASEGGGLKWVKNFPITSPSMTAGRADILTHNPNHNHQSWPGVPSIPPGPLVVLHVPVPTS